LFDLKYSLAKNLLRRKISKKKIDDLLIFLQRYITFADQGYNVKFDKGIGALTGNQKSMGIREMVLEKAKKEGEKEGRLLGLEEGAEKATISFIKNLWETGNYTVSQIASLIKVSEAFVQNTIASK
jgi:predicted transposase YdaD